MCLEAPSSSAKRNARPQQGETKRSREGQRTSEESKVSVQCIDEDECIASVDSSLCFEPGHADVNDFFGDIGFRFALAIDAHRRQCELHLRHSRITPSAEIEPIQIHVVRVEEEEEEIRAA